MPGNFFKELRTGLGQRDFNLRDGLARIVRERGLFNHIVDQAGKALCPEYFRLVGKRYFAGIRVVFIGFQIEAQGKIAGLRNEFQINLPEHGAPQDFFGRIGSQKGFLLLGRLLHLFRNGCIF